jgi:hypothetical protein
MVVSMVAAMLATSPAIGAQSLDVGDPTGAYLRLLEVAGLAERGFSPATSLSLTESRDALEGSAAHPWARHADWLIGDEAPVGASARLRTFVNSSHPRVDNDGAVWQGKGLTTALDARGDVRWRSVTLTLDPTLIYTGNASFDMAVVGLADMPAYAYPWRVIDLPQRFGPDAFWTFDGGQSELAVDWKGARASFGTRNLWWGPAARNPIVMSNSGPGFPHGSLATSGPLDIGIGALEGEWIWGRLGTSEYFDSTVVDTDRFLTGIVLSYAPDFLDGLTLGLTRVFQQRAVDGVPFGDYLLVFQELFKRGLVSQNQPDGTDERDQMLSLFARWTLPESGFEAYVEWARTDHSLDLRDLALEPQHSQGYTLGFQKVVAESPRRLAALRGEVTHLESSPTFQLRPRATYYEHSVVTQGYTHEGQLIGAGVGPGGNAQSLAFDLYAPWGSWGLDFERRVIDNDAFWEWANATGASFDRHNVTLNFGAGAAYLIQPFEISASSALKRELNRYFYDRDAWNVSFSLSARWRAR